jgi:hypothetical protein
VFAAFPVQFDVGKVSSVQLCLPEVVAHTEFDIDLPYHPDLLSRKMNFGDKTSLSLFKSYIV